jgi:type IV secretion system protein TrbF
MGRETMAPVMFLPRKYEWMESNHGTMDIAKDAAYNPYAAARAEFNERWGAFVVRERNWRRIAFISISIALACVIGMVATGYHSRTEPWVVALDSLNRPVPTSPASLTTTKDLSVQEAFVYGWITNIRSVIIDPVAERRQIDDAYALTASDSAAATTINEWLSHNSPFGRMAKETSDVAVESVVPQSPKTFEVVWTETVQDLYGQLIANRQYRGLVTITLQPVTNRKQALLNPLGIYIHQRGLG